MLAVASVLALTLLGAGSYLVIMDQQDRQASAAAAADAERAVQESAAAAVAETKAAEDAIEAERVATEKAETKQKAIDAGTRAERALQVKYLEVQVSKLAKERRTSGYYSEKILKATCMPVTGSSIEELGETSTTFSCIAVTKEKKDGTVSGYEMSGLINWNTGEMSWG